MLIVYGVFEDTGRVILIQTTNSVVSQLDGSMPVLLVCNADDRWLGLSDAFPGLVYSIDVDWLMPLL